MVAPFLRTLRQEQGITRAPSDKVLSNFASRVAEVCGDTWQDDEDSTLGAAARVVYEAYEDEFKK
jgi:hypothetical protein